MWPVEPDGFEPFVNAEDHHDHADAWYFISIEGRFACLSHQGIPQPIAADEYRWLDIEVKTEHYLGRYRGRSCFALEAEGRLPEGYALAGLRDWLGRSEPAVFYLVGRAQQVIGVALLDAESKIVLRHPVAGRVRIDAVRKA